MQRNKFACSVLCFCLIVKFNSVSSVHGQVNETLDVEKDRPTSAKSDMNQERTISRDESATDVNGLIGSNITLNLKENITDKNEIQNRSSNEALNVKLNCSILIIQETPGVIIFKNDTQLAEIITKSNEENGCFLLYFYVPWCEFCAQMSASINIIGRVHYGLPVVAVDAYTYTSIAGKFGITGVPTLLLFYNGRPVAKYNRTRSLHHLKKFIIDYTGFHANQTLESDVAVDEGPLPTTFEERIDSYLVMSLVCFMVIFILNIIRSDSFINYFNARIEKFKSWALHAKTE